MIDYSIVDNKAGGQVVELPAKDTVQVHLRQGSIIAHQDNSDFSIKTTADLLQKPISIVVNPDAQGHADGSLFIDSGISRAELNGDFRYYLLVHNAKSLQKQIAGGNGGNFFAEQGSNALRSEKLDKIIITNAAQYSDTNFACLIDNEFKVYNLAASF
jgi:hypothetical protein